MTVYHIETKLSSKIILYTPKCHGNWIMYLCFIAPFVRVKKITKHNKACILKKPSVI